VFEIGGGRQLGKRPIAVVAKKDAAQKLPESRLSGVALDGATAVRLIDDGDADLALAERGGPQVQAALEPAGGVNNPPHQIPLLTPGMENAACAARLQLVTARDQRDRFLAVLNQDRLPARYEEAANDINEVVGRLFTLELRFCCHEITKYGS
jgi:hypothetical protein